MTVGRDTFTILKARYCPKDPANLISAGVLRDQGIIFNGLNDQVVIKATGEVLLRIDWKHGVATIRGACPAGDPTITSSAQQPPAQETRDQGSGPWIPASSPPEHGHPDESDIFYEAHEYPDSNDESSSSDPDPERNGLFDEQ
ncbi:hypothetical protein G6O67_003821 [Ophiocordyceps sinensis]|uniref:Uncharacterized protein n=2 Tax=Ophiocordyceps sinensis TaxID=72228 RepID=A0A8H4PSN9_9HYPO|nr:hypothetical protein OCS_04239 [Ophiocordyceps sinensis CO18]KAF4509677.1 hypothetical protein G6O67_003821 [Ophiocordyceps sinensis]